MSRLDLNLCYCNHFFVLYTDTHINTYGSAMFCSLQFLMMTGSLCGPELFICVFTVITPSHLKTQICIVEEFIMPIKIVAEHFLALFWAGKMCFNVVHNVANSEGMSRNVWNKIELCWTPPLDIPAPLVIPWRQSKLDIVGDCGNVGRVNTEKASPSHCTALQKRRLFWPNDHCKMPEL